MNERLTIPRLGRTDSSALARTLGRFGGFGSSLVLMSVVNLAVIPLVIAQAGATIWGGIAVAQSVAAFGAVVVAFGWGTTGPSEIAGMESGRRGQFYVNSIATRLWLLVFALPPVMLLVWFIAPGDSLSNAFAAIAILMPALGASWFFVGEKDPWRLLLLENVPRAVGTIVGAVLLISAGSLPLFTGFQAAGAAAAVILSWIDVTKRYRNFAPSFGIKAASRRLPAQAGGMVTASTAALYVNLPLVLVSLFAPGSTAVYAVADKLVKFALTAMSPVIQIAQGYVPSKDPADHRRRATIAAVTAGSLGLIGAVLYASLAPVGAKILSASEVSVTLSLSVPLGIVLGSIVTSAIVGLACLTSFGAIKRVAASTVVGALAGVPLLALGGHFAGVEGVAWAAAISELIVASYQIFFFVRLVRENHSAR